MQENNQVALIPAIKGIWTENKAVLQDYQLDFIMDESKRIIIRKARGIGVSYAGAFKMLLKAIFKKGEYILVSQDKPNSEHILKYIVSFYDNLKNAPFDLPFKLPRLVNCGRDFVGLENGSHIYSKPSEAKAIRGLHGDVFWDETAFTERDREMRAAINGCLRPNFALYMSSTPMEQTGVFFETWDKNKQGGYWKKYDIPYTACNIPEYITQAERDKHQAIEEGWIDDWEREYMCRFVDGATRLYTWELIKSHIEKAKALCDSEYAGADFGKKVDQAIYHEIGMDEQKIIRVCKSIEFNFGEDYSYQLETIIANLKGSKKMNKFYPDATGVGVKLLEDLQRSDIGYITEGVTFTNAEKEKMAMFLYTLLLQDKILLPNDDKLLRQMHGIKRSKTEDGRNRYKHDDGKHDDSFWALCLALRGYMNQEGPATAKIETLGTNMYDEYKKTNWREPEWNNLTGRRFQK